MDYMTARGWLTANERQILVDLAKGKQVIVNIGVEYGASLHCLYQGSPSALIVGVDIDTSKAEVDDLPVVLIEADSTEYVKAWDRGIDLLFVDGLHTYEGVLADLAWLSWLSVGGIVVFHDCYDWPPSPPKSLHGVCPGVNQAVTTWQWQLGSKSGIRAKKSWQEHRPIDTMRIFLREE